MITTDWIREAFDSLSGGGGRSAFGRCRQCGQWIRYAKNMQRHVKQHEAERALPST